MTVTLFVALGMVAGARPAPTVGAIRWDAYFSFPGEPAFEVSGPVFQSSWRWYGGSAGGDQRSIAPPALSSKHVVSHWPLSKLGTAGAPRGRRASQ